MAEDKQDHTGGHDGAFATQCGPVWFLLNGASARGISKMRPNQSAISRDWTKNLMPSHQSINNADSIDHCTIVLLLSLHSNCSISPHFGHLLHHCTAAISLRSSLNNMFLVPLESYESEACNGAIMVLNRSAQIRHLGNSMCIVIELCWVTEIIAPCWIEKIIPLQTLLTQDCTIIKECKRAYGPIISADKILWLIIIA